MNSRSHIEDQLFQRAIALPRESRDALLDMECSGNPALRASIDARLQRHAFAPVDLQASAPAFAETVTQQIVRSDEQAGDRIGRYKLLQTLGEGGCGVVYMAEQEEPVRRRVALKVIKLGMDTKAVVARFEAERQALAMMDHPNIARVFDAGTTDVGRPFFVMELVKGVPITTYCDDHHLSPRERLTLFVTVCHAIQHAHQKGIIHRDIKPSNVLVTLHEGVAVPKVIDFGIAKATQGRLTDQTLFTAVEQFIGTPAYMSPEQAEMSGLDIDTRADIYSLGVLLYEVLVGHPPFDPKSFSEVGLDSIRRTIREVEPPRPSTRITTLTNADRSTLAKLRGVQPTQLTTLLSGDLDWIVMKAMDKNRVRRYESAAAFAADIERHLNNEPVQARPPSAAYLFQKFVRRHRVAFAAGSAVLVALVLGLGVATWSFIQEKAARQRAVSAEQEQSRLRTLAETARAEEARQRGLAEAGEKKARSEAVKSQQAFNFMAGMLTGVGPSVAAGRDTTLLREILDQTLRRLDFELKDQPEVEVSLRGALGAVYLDLGEPEKADAMINETLAQAEKLHGHNSEEVAAALAYRALVRLSQNQPAAAEVAARDAERIYRQLPGNHDSQLSHLLYCIGSAQFAQFFLADAEASFREALVFARKNPDQQSAETDGVLMALANVLEKQGRLAEAEPMIREAIAGLTRRSGPEHPAVAMASMVLANVLMNQGKLVEADALYRVVFPIFSKTYGNEHPEVVRMMLSRAALAFQMDKLDEAEALTRTTLDLQRRVLGAESSAVTDSLQLLAQILARQGKGAEAENVGREAAAILQKTRGVGALDEARGKAQTAATAMQHQNFAEAEQLLRAALAESTDASGRAPDDMIPARLMLAQALFAQGRAKDAEAVLHDALAASQKAFGEKSTYVATGLLLLAQAQQEQGELAAAESSLRTMLQVTKSFTTSGENAQVADGLLLLATMRARRGDSTQAATLARQAGAIAHRLPETQPNHTLQAVERIRTHLREQGKSVEAEAVDRVIKVFTGALNPSGT